MTILELAKQYINLREQVDQNYQALCDALPAGKECIIPLNVKQALHVKPCAHSMSKEKAFIITPIEVMRDA